LCNDPFGEEWTVIESKCTNSYHPEILFEEVQTWVRKVCGRYVRRDELRYWHILDEEGLIGIEEQRDPRDGERYAIVLQAQNEEEDAELKWRPEDPGGRIQGFIKQTRWRRLESRYKIEVETPEIRKPPDEESRTWSSVEESIRRKHVRYRQRFKQRRRILAEGVSSSPLAPDMLAEFQELQALELKKLKVRLAAEELRARWARSRALEV
jgi:hypothetical protein